MARMALPLLMLLLFASPLDAKEEKKKDESCDATVKKLKARLEALESENAQMKKQIADAAPYLSTGTIVDSLGSVTEYAMSQGSLDKVDLAPVYSASKVSYEAIQKATSQATAASSNGIAAAMAAMQKTSEMAQDLHGKHVSQHTGEYYDVALDAYTTHLSPHVSTARKAYYDTVHPHVGKASETMYASFGAAMEGGKSLSPKITDVLKLGMKSVTDAWNGQLVKQLDFLVKSQSFTVLGRTFNFNHGFLDIALAAVQGLIGSYLAFMILWKLCLSTIVWKIGVQILGRKVVWTLINRVVKVCYRVTIFLLSIGFTLVLTVLALAFSWIMLAICGGLGVAMLHVIEQNAKVGLKPGIRLSLGVGIGLFFWLLVRCTCCKKRKAAKAVNGKAAAKGNKQEPKKAAAAKTDAKKGATPTKKK